MFRKINTFTVFGLEVIAIVLVIAFTSAAEFCPHEVRRMGGPQGELRIPAQIQIVTESWNRVVAVPYIVYLPEKDRVLMLVGCDYPHHAEVLTSDDHGATWSSPRIIWRDESGNPVSGLGVSLTNLGGGKLLMHAGSSRIFSEDSGETWGNPVPVGPTPDGKPWYTWDPLLVECDAKTDNVTRLIETGYTWQRPPEVEKAHQQAYLRFSTDLGRTWDAGIKTPQWKEVSEVALLRVGNGELLAACRTDIPKSKEGEWIDHYEGLGISFSQDDGHTWSDVTKLYDWGRHHPSLLLLPNGHIVMTYVVSKGYIDTTDGFPQFGIEAVISRDHGHTWDLDHRYILHSWKGNRTDANKWWASCQATSTIMFPDGSLLTAFGTGYRSEPTEIDNQPAPRDVGLILWRVEESSCTEEHALRDAAFDSDLRNVMDPAAGRALE